MWAETAVSSKASTPLHRLSVVMEENSLHEFASTVMALQPISSLSSSSAYIAVAAYPNGGGSSSDAGSRRTGSFGAPDMADLLKSYNIAHQDPQNDATAPACDVVTALQKPALQLCLYSLHLPYGHKLDALAAVAPDMMLIQTANLTFEDLRLALPQQYQSAGKANGGKGNQSTSPAGPRDTGLSLEAVVVDQVAWIGVQFIAIKTRQRQLLLVKTGLTECTGSASNDGYSSDGEAWAEAMTRQPQSRVCKAFSHVADFCSVVLPTSSHHCGAVSCLFVAGMQHVSVVVVCGAAPDTKARSTMPLQEYIWNIGPFNSISAAAVPATSTNDSAVLYLCGASACNSVEVYRWPLNSTAPPMCVHNVLMAPGHFFYGSSVTLHDCASSDGASIDFWVVGAAAADPNSQSSMTQLQEGVSNGFSESLLLPSLRGPDGRCFQVKSPSPTSLKTTEELMCHSMPSTEHRILNGAWQGSAAHCEQTKSRVEPNDSPSSVPAAAVTATAASLMQLESMVSLRISAPRFLPFSGRPSSGKSIQSPATFAEMQRYLLHIHTSAEPSNEGKDETYCSAMSTPSAVSKHGWSSELLSLDTTECAAALRWLAEDDDAADEQNTVKCSPSWKLDPFTTIMKSPQVATNVATVAATSWKHELTLHTSRRILKLCVDCPPSRSSINAKDLLPLEVRVGGTHKLPSSEYAAGLCTLPLVHGITPLLLLSGSGHSVDNDGPSEQQKVSFYGQSKPKKTWRMVTCIHVSLLLSLSPWNASGREGGKNRGAAHVETEELLAAVTSMVAAESSRLQRHFDTRMDRLEALLGQVASRLAK